MDIFDSLITKIRLRGVHKLAWKTAGFTKQNHKKDICKPEVDEFRKLNVSFQ